MRYGYGGAFIEGCCSLISTTWPNVISLGHPHSGLLHLFLFSLALTLVSISISILICQLFSPYPPLPTPLFVPFLIALRHPLGRFRFDFYDFAPRTLCLICILYSIRIRFQFVFVIHVYLALPLPQLLPLPLCLPRHCGRLVVTPAAAAAALLGSSSACSAANGNLGKLKA